MNTVIRYLYRDASNYKKMNVQIVRGEITDEQKETIFDCLNEGLYFVPSQVGLPEERFDLFNDDDHAWFELGEDAFGLTDAAPTQNITVEDLVRYFKAARGRWDDKKWWDRVEHLRDKKVTVIIWKGILDEVLSNIPGVDVKVIDYDPGLGSSDEELDKMLHAIKSSGQKEVFHTVEHCIPEEMREEFED